MEAFQLVFQELSRRFCETQPAEMEKFYFMPLMEGTFIPQS